MKFIPAVFFLVLLMSAATSHAIPLLQLYVEGAIYDTDHESWVFDNDGESPIRLWVIGNTAGPGSKGVIEDVKIAVTYANLSSDKDASVTLTSSTTSEYGGFTDPSTASVADFVQFNDDGSIPLMGDGQPISRHGVYGEGWEWQEFALGDFELTDSPIGDFIGSFPVPSEENLGQINVYELVIEGDITDVHFDAYDHVQSGNKARYIFAPYSHDAGTGINSPVSETDPHFSSGTNSVPEPISLTLMGLGLVGLAITRRKKKTAAI